MIADRSIVGLGALLRIEHGSRVGRAGRCFVVLSSGHGAFRLRAPGEPRGGLCTRAVVPAGAEYVLEGDGVERATAFLEADGILGRRARYELDATTRSGSTAWIEAGQRLVPADLWRHAVAGDWPMAFHRLACALDRKRRGLAYAGAKVQRAAALVESQLPERISLAALAGALGLTLEQLTRLLLDEVGLAARPFVSWLRLRRHATLVGGGATVDEAARAVGYRRRAELAQDWRRLFGSSDHDTAPCPRLAPLADLSFADLRIA